MKTLVAISSSTFFQFSSVQEAHNTVDQGNLLGGRFISEDPLHGVVHGS